MNSLHVSPFDLEPVSRCAEAVAARLAVAGNVGIQGDLGEAVGTGGRLGDLYGGGKTLGRWKKDEHHQSCPFPIGWLINTRFSFTPLTEGK